MVYRSSKGKFTMAVLYGIVIVFLPALAVALSLSPWPLMVPGTAVVLTAEIWIIWTMADTKFTLDAHHFSFRSGPWKQTVRIEDIRKISYSDSWIKPSLLKVGLDMKGLIIYYNKFDDIFISPENRDAFLDEISGLNPAIQVIRSES